MKSWILLAFAVAGCGGADYCMTSSCSLGGATYQGCRHGDSITYTFGSGTCTCDATASVACADCLKQVAGYCNPGVGGGVGGGGGSGGGTAGGDCTPGGGGSTATYVLDTITLPTTNTQFGYDLVGDGRKENQFGRVISALAQQGMMPQAGFDAAIQSGQLVMLLGETSTDASFTHDSCASAVLQPGAPASMPPTAGATYTPTGTPGNLSGPIANATFDSTATATTKMPVQVQLALPLVPGTQPMPLNIVGAHVRLTYAGGRISGGQLNGAIKQSDIDGTLIPAVAASLQAKLAADHGNPTSTDESILSLFDTGGVVGPTASGCSTSCAGTCQNRGDVANPCACARANDGFVDECEVATNTVIKNVFSADVQLFDAAGNWKPNPQPTAKDSLSIGLGFTAIPARF